MFPWLQSPFTPSVLRMKRDNQVVSRTTSGPNVSLVLDAEAFESVVWNLPFILEFSFCYVGAWTADPL